MEVPVNYLAVVVAALANYIVGAIWYAGLFGKAWVKLSGTSEMKMTALSAVLGLVCALFTSYILAHTVIFASAYLKTGGIGAGLTTGFFNWLGFIAPLTLGVATVGPETAEGRKRAAPVHAARSVPTPKPRSVPGLRSFGARPRDEAAR